LTQDPVDDVDGQDDDPAASRPSAEEALEPPPEAGEAELFERRARLAEDRLTEVLSAYRKVKTENEGFRDRVTRDVERTFSRRHEKLLLKFIDILDNLDRALEAAEQTYAGNPLIEGLILVRTQLLQTLQQEGLERIPVLGLPFDPAVSEAVGTQPVEDPEQEHVVVREVLRGYKLHGRVARASRVFIGLHNPAAAAAAPGSEPEIGADEARAAAAAVSEALADTVPIDEETMRELFGIKGHEPDEPDADEPDAGLPGTGSLDPGEPEKDPEDK
jgi:molecular chaperone GrpE